MKHILKTLLTLLIRLWSHIYTYRMSQWLIGKRNMLYTLWIRNFLGGVGKQTSFQYPLRLEGGGSQRIRIGAKTVIGSHYDTYLSLVILVIQNFVKTMLNLTSTKPQLKVVFDQVGTPTYAYDLAQAITTILDDYKKEIGNCQLSTVNYSKSGVYHYSNEGVCSWYDFTKMIAEYSGQTGCDIQPCHSEEFPSPVKRPSYSVLDKTKVKQTFGLTIPYWTDSLRKCISNLQAK